MIPIHSSINFIDINPKDKQNSVSLALPTVSHLFQYHSQTIKIIKRQLGQMNTYYHKYKESTNQIFSQYPLFFTCCENDKISRHLTSFGNTFHERIVYMGVRYSTSYQAFKAFGRMNGKQDQQIQKEFCQQSELYCSKTFCKFSYENSDKKEKIIPARAEEYRLFKGMNPTTSKDELQFDSNFQCGNLDLSVKVSDNEYDLFMRVDSNTKGHNCWFFFKVFQFKKQSKVKFNIYNFSKQDLMYTSGHKIYTFSSSRKKWIQEGQNIEFKKPSKIKYVDEEGNECFFWKNQTYCLSFEYTFNTFDQYVYFSFCIPYSYSYLLSFLEDLQQKNEEIVQIQYKDKTTGGLKIPVITIDSQQSNIFCPSKYKNNKKKPTCLIIGRLHPGQSQASWLLHGFITFICSPAATYLRESMTFKIVPMVNIDGVTLGNFRTGLIGRDLNRLFNLQLSKQVKMVRSLASQYRPFIFLDFHGHSSKKYIFAYGPDYSIDHSYFLPSRLLPKLLEKSSKSFRYFACSYKIAENRQTTARAVMLRQFLTTYSYTLETSVYGYGPKLSEKQFDPDELRVCGQQLGRGFLEFIKIIFTIPKRLQQTNQIPLVKQKSSLSKILSKKDSFFSSQYQIMKQFSTAQTKKLLNDILAQEQKDQQKNKGLTQEQDSDFEEGQDYTDVELTKLLHEDQKTEHLHIRRISQCSKRNSRNQGKIWKTATEKSEREASQEKSCNKSQKLRKKQHINRQTKSKIYKEIPCISPFINRNMVGKSKYSPALFSQDEDQNKINYNISLSEPEEKDPLVLNYSVEKVTLVNHGNLKPNSVYINNSYQPFSESKTDVKQKPKKFKKDSIIIKSKKSIKNQDSKIKMSFESKFEVKHPPALPMLGRSGNIDVMESKTLIEDIIERHERMKMSKARKQLKIIKF